jgi:8-oxo-dGTP diphosphatase
LTEYRYCPVCGEDFVEKELDGRTRLVCSACGFVFYRNPAPAAGVILIENDEILWVKRKFEPRKDMWTFPAGFLEYDEHVEECAVRETREETGVDVELIRLFGAYMAMDDPRVQVVLLLYLARRVGGELKAGDDASEARYFPINEPPEEIAFQAHRLALNDIYKLDTYKKGR